MISIEQALQLIDENVSSASTENVPLSETVGRTLSENVLSDVDSPPHDKSIMDGFAVLASDVSAGKLLKVIETVPAGTVPKKILSSGQATRIMTGAPLPQGADAVVMIEQTQFDEAASEVQIELDSIDRGRHTMKQASAMAKGEVIFDAGHRVRGQDVGLLAEGGAARPSVFVEPSLAILPTGDELVDCSEFPGPGMIRNSNGPMLVQLAKEQSSKVTDLGIGRDNRDELIEKVAKGLESDFLILSGGVSAGMLDLVPDALNASGVTQVFHKVAIKPGKPIWFGVKDHGDRQSFVFGLPGNPVSSLVGFQMFVRSALSVWHGKDVQQSARRFQATLATEHQVRGDRITYWPVYVFQDGVERRAEPVNWRGSSDLRALGKANGLGVFDPNQSADFKPGTNVEILGLGVE